MIEITPDVNNKVLETNQLIKKLDIITAKLDDEANSTDEKLPSKNPDVPDGTDCGTARYKASQLNRRIFLEESTTKNYMNKLQNMMSTESNKVLSEPLSIITNSRIKIIE